MGRYTTKSLVQPKQDLSDVRKNKIIDETEATESSATDDFIEEIVSSFDLVNRERASRSLKPLKSNEVVQKLAQKIVNRIAQLDDVSKVLIPMKTLQSLLKSGWVAQNVAEGKTELDMHNDLMAVASRDNILSKKFKVCGIATAENTKSGKIYMVQLFRGKKNDT